MGLEPGYPDGPGINPLIAASWGGLGPQGRSWLNHIDEKEDTGHLN